MRDTRDPAWEKGWEQMVAAMKRSAEAWTDLANAIAALKASEQPSVKDPEEDASAVDEFLGDTRTAGHEGDG